VHSNFGDSSSFWGVAELGGIYAPGGSGFATMVTTTLRETMAVGEMPPSSRQHLLLSLMDPVFTGSFDSLRFVVQEGASKVVDVTFADVTTAMAYFDDQTLDLGSLAGITGNLDLALQFYFTSHIPGTGYSLELLCGNSTLGSGPPVPLPGTVWLLGSSILGLVAWGWGRGRRAGGDRGGEEE
jgi:hypothetical protein